MNTNKNRMDLKDEDIINLMDKEFIGKFNKDIYAMPTFEQKAHKFLITLKDNQPIHIAELSRKLGWCKVSITRYLKVFGFAIDCFFIGRNKMVKLKNKFGCDGDGNGKKIKDK